MFRTRASLFDAMAVAVVLLIAVLLFLIPFFGLREGRTLLVTTARGTTEYDLSKDRQIELHENGIALTVVIEDGKAFVQHSDCPDGVCMASGRIARSGESILCAPAGVTLTVKGGGDDVDFVAG